MRRLISVSIAALLLIPGAANAQATPQTTPAQLRALDAYSQALSGAKQVIVYAPRLSDAPFVDSLKVMVNLGVPVTVLTSKEGLLMSNGYLMSLSILPLAPGAEKLGGPRLNPMMLEVYGDVFPHTVLEVETRTGWRAYFIETGMPRQVKIAEVKAFNQWYARWSKTLPVFNPLNVFKLWAQANLGEKLN